MHLITRLIAVVLALLIPSLSTLQAQDWPSKPLTMIVPFPPASTSDINARLVAQEMSKLLGQNITIDNKPGANGNIGTAMAARARTDGYTIVLSGVGINGINPALYKDMQYDSVKDFVHFAKIAWGPNAIAVHPNFPAKTLDELVQFARANPGKYSYASSGTGSSEHMAMEMFKRKANVKFEHVPYKGARRRCRTW